MVIVVFGLGSWIGFFGLEFSVDGVWGLCCELSGFFGFGALDVNVEELPWEKTLPLV